VGKALVKQFFGSPSKGAPTKSHNKRNVSRPPAPFRTADSR